MGELRLMISTEATWEGGEVSTLRLLCTARQCISIDLTIGHLTAPEDTHALEACYIGTSGPWRDGGNVTQIGERGMLIEI